MQRLGAAKTGLAAILHWAATLEEVCEMTGWQGLWAKALPSVVTGEVGCASPGFSETSEPGLLFCKPGGRKSQWQRTGSIPAELASSVVANVSHTNSCRE